MVERIAIRADTETESTKWVKKERFPGKVSTLPQNIKTAADELVDQRDELGEVSFWRDRTRLDSGKAGAGVGERYLQAWKTQKMHMATNKEVFNAELYAVAEALEVFLRRG